MYDAADDAAIVLSLDTTHIGWQVSFDPLPLLVAQPKQIPAHDPNPFQKNQYRIVTAEKLMSSHPSRRFPPPWSIEETGACFIVRDANGQALAYVYFEEEPGRRAATRLMTRDEGSHLQCICKVGHSP